MIKVAIPAASSAARFTSVNLVRFCSISSIPDLQTATAPHTAPRQRMRQCIPKPRRHSGATPQVWSQPARRRAKKVASSERRHKAHWPTTTMLGAPAKYIVRHQAEDEEPRTDG